MGWVKGQARTSSKLDWSTVPRKVRDVPEGPVLGSRDNFRTERKAAETPTASRFVSLGTVLNKHDNLAKATKPSEKALAKQRRMAEWEARHGRR